MSDVTLCSFQKSGRTYLRFILAHYFNDAFQLGVTIDFDGMFQILPNLSGPEERGLGRFRFRDREGLPLVASTHERFSEKFSGSRMIYLFRAPHDTLTSLYFHEVHHAQRFDGAPEDLLAPPKDGGRDACSEWAEHMNSWAKALPSLQHMTLTYERLLADPVGEVDGVLRFLGVVPDPAGVRAAVEKSSFERMKELEVSGRTIPAVEYDPSDVRARRVREGVVGGHARHLSPELIARVSERLDSLLCPEAKALLVSQGLSYSAAGHP